MKKQGFVVVVLAVVLFAASVDSQEQEAEFIPDGATRPLPGRPLFRPFPGRPQFGGDEPGLVIVRRLPSASSNRPSISLFDILTKAISADNFFGDGSHNRFPFGDDSSNRIPIYNIDRPGINEDETPFPEFPTFTKPEVPTFGGFGDFFNSFIPRIPQSPDLTGYDFNLEDLPENYNNKTHTVETIDGNRVEVNSTIKKDGNTFFQFHVVQLRPSDESSGSSQVPEDVETTTPDIDASSSKPNGIIPPTSNPVSEAVSEDPTTPYEDFGEKHDRIKRFSLPNFITRYFVGKATEGKATEAPSYVIDLNSPSNHIDVNPNNPKSHESLNESPVLVDISGDTRVNYLARNVESEALVDDVEIFDWDLVREEARRNGFNNNLQSKPLNSESLQVHPMGILSVMSEPITPQTVRSQPMKNQSISHQLTRSESLGLDVEPISHQSERMHPVRNQSSRPHQRQTQSLRLQSSHQIPPSTYNDHDSSHSIRHQRHRTNQ